MKVHLKEQFRQFVLPETTSMRPLPNKVTTKGALKKDKQSIRSTRRSPSLWEIVDSQEQETQGSQTRSTGTKKPTPVEVHIPHKDQIPIWMHGFIEKVTDVPSDGHCGFQAVAVLRNLTVDDHTLVRYNLYKELIGVENVRY